MSTEPIRMSSTRILRAVSIIAVALLIVNLAMQYAVHAAGLDLHGALHQVDVGRERNLPTAFTIVLLLSCCALLGAIAARTRQAGDPDSPRWALLAMGLAAMAYDEAFSVHERFIEPVRALLGRDDPSDLGALYYAWIIPGTALVVVVGLFFLGFLRRLPAWTRRRFVLAGALYLTGVLALEAIGGWYDARHGYENMPYAVICSAEEGAEMAGMIVFLAALLRTVNERFGELTIRFDANRG